MSFGFGIGDFVGVAELAWNLYRYCYVVARGAPHEFQLLLQEITTLSQSIKLVQLETQDPDSTLVRAGEDRVRMVKEMMSRVEVTLKELDKHAKKYEKLGDSSRSKRKQMWDKFKWSVDASDLDALRNKLVYHNGVINLLLTSCGNSSLQRIESSNLRLERRFSQIGDLVQKLGGQNPSALPVVSAINNQAFKTTLLSATLMKNAEIGRRRWSAIGVDEWIQAGRWWLLKSQSVLSGKLSAGQIVPKQGYANLIKSSWILIDVIARHPQLNLLDPEIRYDAEVLAEAIRNQLEDMDNSGYLMPSFEDIQACDLSIWETQAKGVSLQPAKQTSMGGLAGDSYHSWETADEQVLFQRFAHYQASKSGASVPCVILFVAHKTDKRASVVLRDQSWITLATFIVGETTLERSGNTLSIGDQRIIFSTPLDTQYLGIAWMAVEEYALHCVRRDHWYEVLQVLVLLIAVKEEHVGVVKWLLQDIKGPSPQQSLPLPGLKTLVTQLATKYVLDYKRDLGEYCGIYCHSSPFIWAAQNGHKTVAVLLAELKDIHIDEEQAEEWASIQEATRQGPMEKVGFLLCEGGAKINIYGTGNPSHSALYIAASGGYESIVEMLLQGSAKVDMETLRVALKVAAREGHDVIFDKLLKAGANAYSIYSYTDTALQAAAHGGHDMIVDKLLKAKDGIHTLDITASLRIAAQRGHDMVVDKLLRAGADVNARGDSYEATALQAAADGGHDVIVDKLLKAGADVNAPPSEYAGFTALQAAAHGGHDVIVDKLLKAGADVNARAATNGLTALGAAAQGGHDVIVDKLVKAGVDVNAPPSEYGCTALQAAVRGGHDVIVDKLLKAGADVNARATTSGLTALGAAAHEGHDVIVDKLLKAGADVNAPGTPYGFTALDVAVEKENDAVVEKLLKAGADANALKKTYAGVAPSWMAAKEGRGLIVNMLHTAGVVIY